MEKISKNLFIYTEEELLSHLVAGRPFRPAQSFIFLVRQGSYEIKYNLAHHSLETGAILFINKNTVYEFTKTDPHAIIRLVAIHPSFESIAAIKIRNLDIFSFLIQSNLYHYHVSDGEFEEIWHLTESLRRKTTAAPQSKRTQQMVHHLFLALVYILADLSERYNRIKIIELTRADELTINFFNLVHKFIKTEKSVLFYAAQMGISAKHLSETVKASSGQTAGQIINSALMTEAKILLANPDININKTAQELGFSDQYAFSKFFKRMTGITPSDFKASI
ncbi:MAG: helix-turn-helix domain-containing protein [Breznakibacter sp.]